MPAWPASALLFFCSILSSPVGQPGHEVRPITLRRIERSDEGRASSTSKIPYALNVSRQPSYAVTKKPFKPQPAIQLINEEGLPWTEPPESGGQWRVAAEPYLENTPPLLGTTEVAVDGEGQAHFRDLAVDGTAPRYVILFRLLTSSTPQPNVTCHHFAVASHSYYSLHTNVNTKRGDKRIRLSFEVWKDQEFATLDSTWHFNVSVRRPEMFPDGILQGTTEGTFSTQPTTPEDLEFSRWGYNIELTIQAQSTTTDQAFAVGHTKPFDLLPKIKILNPIPYTLVVRINGTAEEAAKNEPLLLLSFMNAFGAKEDMTVQWDHPKLIEDSTDIKWKVRGEYKQIKIFADKFGLAANRSDTFAADGITWKLEPPMRFALYDDAKLVPWYGQEIPPPNENPYPLAMQQTDGEVKLYDFVPSAIIKEGEKKFQLRLEILMNGTHQIPDFSPSWRYVVSVPHVEVFHSDLLGITEGAFIKNPTIVNLEFTRWAYYIKLDIDIYGDSGKLIISNYTDYFNLLPKIKILSTLNYTFVVKINDTIEYDVEHEAMLSFVNTFGVTKNKSAVVWKLPERSGATSIRWQVRGGSKHVKYFANMFWMAAKRGETFSANGITWALQNTMYFAPDGNSKILPWYGQDKPPIETTPYIGNFAVMHLVLIFVVCILILPVIFLLIFWRKRERRLREQYEARLMGDPEPDKSKKKNKKKKSRRKNGKDNTGFISEQSVAANTSTASQPIPNPPIFTIEEHPNFQGNKSTFSPTDGLPPARFRWSAPEKTDVVELTMAQLREQHRALIEQGTGFNFSRYRASVPLSTALMNSNGTDDNTVSSEKHVRQLLFPPSGLSTKNSRSSE